MEGRRSPHHAHHIQFAQPPWLPGSQRRQGEGSKKTPETEEIFERVRSVNALADACEETVRISLDTKAVVHVGEYSRGGKSRGAEAVKALDHDMRPKEKLVPGGILEVGSNAAFLFFSSGGNTSDFLGDGLDAWWRERRDFHPNAKRLVINLDNGPDCSGHRTQFLQRVVEFVDTSGLEVRLAYYPPYHSKYRTPDPGVYKSDTDV